MAKVQKEYKGIQIRFSKKAEERWGQGWYAVIPVQPRMFQKESCLFATYEDVVSAIDSNQDMCWH